VLFRSLVYAASARLRRAIARHGQATLQLDLLPGRSRAQLAEALAKGRGSRSWTNHLKEHAGLSGVKAALLRERWPADVLAQRLAQDPAGLAAELKAWPMTVVATRPLDEAISSAGGVRLEALDPLGMLQALPGVFCAGEMLDWEAPTGGYLLNASLASGRVAAQGMLAWLAQRGVGPSGATLEEASPNPLIQLGQGPASDGTSLPLAQPDSRP
jgi:predicted flavoprotein YhiN